MSQPPRIRRDPRELAASRARAAPPRPLAEAEKPATPIRIDDPACHVLAVPDLQAGRLSRADRELMGAARHLADLLGGAVVLLGGRGPEVPLQMQPEQEGADRSILPVHDAFAGELAEPRVAFVLAAARACEARHLLFPETMIGGEVGRRVAAALRERPATQVRRFSATEATAGADAGRLDVRRPLPRVVIPEPDAFLPVPAGPKREARPLAVACTPLPPRAAVTKTFPADPASISLTEAELILSAGAGVTDWAAFHDAAAALGAAEAGSRAVCDAGHLPRDRQVGVSGLLVAPRCYLAFGIAGASQHLHGITDAERVVAVNSDAGAEIMERADLAIIGDAQAVLPALARRARRRQTAPHGS
jgi:electron transfer flavoprotein alpha subunit